MKTFTLKCPDMRWKGCNMFEPGATLFDLICVQYVYSISSKSMRSKSRRGWTCCRTSSSTSMHSASKTKSCIHLNCFGVESTWKTYLLQFVMVVFWLSNVKLPENCQFIQFQSLNSSVTILCWHRVTFMCFLFSFFQDGLKAVDNLKPSIEKLATDLHTVRKTAALVFVFLCVFFSFTGLWHFHHICIIMYMFLLCSFSPVFSIFPLRQIKQVQDEERKQLTQLRDVLKSALQVEQKEVTYAHTHTHTRPAEGVQLLFNVKERQSNVTFTLKWL